MVPYDGKNYDLIFRGDMADIALGPIGPRPLVVLRCQRFFGHRKSNELFFRSQMVPYDGKNYDLISRGAMADIALGPIGLRSLVVLGCQCS